MTTVRRTRIIFWVCTVLSWKLRTCNGVGVLRSFTNPLVASVQEKFAPAEGCLSISDISIHDLNLTESERQLLPFVCLPEDEKPFAFPPLKQTRRGIPPGIECSLEEWCDGNACTQVCARGSVVIEPWLAAATRLQAHLVRSLPFCYGFLMGTHNSAITLADGYGNLDGYFQSWFKYIKWASEDFSHSLLRTNNQYLSLTDQLNLGVRSIELDTHWVGGILRIAHCGGLHVGPLNQLIEALNLIAKLLHQHIRWDTETMGCAPSLSSIPALEQRPLSEAMDEVAAWMNNPENKEEFLILYFDDQPDLGKWGVASHLQQEILRAFPREIIYTSDDQAAYAQSAGGKWPTMAELVKAGKRLVFVSGSDYGIAMRPLIFSRGEALCNWSEAPLESISGIPDCTLGNDLKPMFDGYLLRVATCELEYGPMNCEFVWKGSNEPYLDELTLPTVLGCGLNLPAVDLLTPSKAAAAVWTWADGHPYVSGASCAVINAHDGRWQAIACDSGTSIPSACRKPGNVEQGILDTSWVLGTGISRGACPQGTYFDVPRHPRENYELAWLLLQSNAEYAWLPLQGPTWMPADIFPS